MTESNVSVAIKILKWASHNKKTLTEACKYFDVNERYLRTRRLAINKKKQLSNEEKEFKILYAAAKGQHPDFERIEPKISGGKKSTINSDGTASYEYDGEKMITTLDEAIKFFKIDTKLWEIERFVCNSYPVSAKYRDQDLQFKDGVMTGHAVRKNEWLTKVNYQVKIFVKKKADVARAFTADKIFADLLKSHSPYKYKDVKYPTVKEKNLLEINIFDLHMGKLCWGEEVGNNYDMKIASRRFNEALHGLIDRAGKGTFERILFIIGNDFYNSDTHTGTTTEGTRQDEDGRWQKTFRRGKELMIEGIDYMRQFAPVDVLVIPGNHDWTKSFYLGEALTSWYRSDKNVKVDNSPNPRKYYLYGKTLLGFTHGDKEHNGALRMLMPIEVPKEWAKSKYREFHCGHWHRELEYREVVVTKKNASTTLQKVPLSDEQLSIVVRHMRSLAGTDGWHHGKGYVGPIKGASAFLWNHDTGLAAQFHSTIRR